MSSSATTESRFLSSALAAYGSQGGRTVLRLITDLTLARLVLPEYHGLFDLAYAAVVIAGIVRDMGLPYQLVRDERQPYGTVAAWTSASGLVLAGLLAAVSPLFSSLDPKLPAVVAGLAPLLFVEGLSIAPRVYFERRLEVGRLVVPEIARGAALAVVAISMAAAGAGVWSFVAGELAGMAVFATLLWRRAWGRMPRRVQPGLLGDLLLRSRYLFAIAMCAFALPFVERFVVAPFITTALVAQFNKARYLGQKVQVLLVPAVQRVLYPALVELRLHPRRAFGAFRVGTVSILAFEALAAWFLFFNAHTVVLDILFGSQWGAAVPLLRILAFLPLVNPMSRLGGEVLKVRGEDRLWLIIVVLDLASLLGFGLWFSSHWGATGMAWAEFLLLGNLLMTWRIARILGRDFWRLVGDLAFVYLVPAVPFLPVLWLFPVEGWERFVASLAAAAVGTLLLAARFYRPFRAWFAGGHASEVTARGGGGAAVRVAFVMSGLGVVNRGAEAFVVEIATALARRGAEVTLLGRGPLALPDGLPLRFHRLRAVSRDARWLRRLYAATRLGRKALDTLFLDPINVEWASAALAAFPALWSGGYDVVVMEGGLVGARLCRLLRRLRGVGFVDVAHGVDPKWEGAFARQRPDRVVTFTAAAAAMIGQRAPGARVSVVPHGVDLERFRPGLEPAEHGLAAPVVMVAGAVDEHKRTAAALAAVAALGDRGRPASLLVLGDGPLAADLDRRAATALPPGRYRRLVVPRADMPRWYAAADVFTLPSRTESFGLAYLEALACGRPCVAPDDAVRREVIGDAGLFADPSDPDAYAIALAAALDREWGEGPRRRAECFPFAATVDAWQELLAAVAAEHGKAADHGRAA